MDSQVGDARRARYVGLCALSAAALIYELSLTRIFAVAQGYHFAFLSLSLALLGFGASGAWLAVRAGRPGAEPRLDHLALATYVLTFSALGRLMRTWRSPAPWLRPPCCRMRTSPSRTALRPTCGSLIPATALELGALYRRHPCEAAMTLSQIAPSDGHTQWSTRRLGQRAS